MSLTCAVPNWPGHLPGQHIDVRLTAEDGYQAQRSYSLASPPEERERITITVEQLEDGEVSSYLDEVLRSGDQLELRGPIGGYFVWKTDMGGPLLLIGGGVGVVPLMAMLRHYRLSGCDIPVRLLYSARTYEDIIYRDELANLVREQPAIEIKYTLTREAPADWTGYRRRVDLDMLREIVWTREQRPLTYICGPTPFAESVANDLIALGYEPERVRIERFGPTGDE